MLLRINTLTYGKSYLLKSLQPPMVIYLTFRHFKVKLSKLKICILKMKSLCFDFFQAESLNPLKQLKISHIL